MIVENPSEKDSYTVSFSIKYETKFGQNIYLYGSIPELGEWKNRVAKLKWTTGHIWRLDLTLSSSIQYFEYKFVIADNDQLIWEKGHNRLFSKRQYEHDDHINLSAIWERLFITFMIYFPSTSPDETLQIMGGATSIGKWFKEGGKPMQMKLGIEKNMYNIRGRFWEFRAELDVNDAQNYDFEYRYSLYNTKLNSALWEREPNRRIILLNDPKLLTISQEEYDKMFPVSNKEYEILLNHDIVRFDTNFVWDFVFNKVGNYPIYIGPYPQNGKDIEMLHNAGITAVLNIQSDLDHLHRQINWEANMKAYSQHNMRVQRYPIIDFNTQDLISKIKAAGDILHNLVQNNYTVFVHCTAGMSRAAAVIIIYLYYYQFMSLQDAYNFLKEHRSIICPNLGAIQEVINNNEREDIEESKKDKDKENVKGKEKKKEIDRKKEIEKEEEKEKEKEMDKKKEIEKKKEVEVEKEKKKEKDLTESNNNEDKKKKKEITNL